MKTCIAALLFFVSLLSFPPVYVLSASETTGSGVGDKKTICLNMIVKDEKDVIIRCLSSIKPIIDHWVIVDTGSTDGTQELIREYMKDIPGELYERPWKNFEHNRNEALSLAKEKGDYVLIIDADDFLEYASGFVLPSLTKGSYRLWIHYGGTVYQRHHVIDMSLPWKWVGVVHEVLTSDAAYESDVLDGVRMVIGGGGARSKDPKKFEKDAQRLEEALAGDPENTRYMFYLAQSYRDAGMFEKSIEWYLKRVYKGNRDEEVYWSLLQVGLMEKALKRPYEVVMDRLLNAYRRRPYRPEAVYFLAEMYREHNQYDQAYAMLKFREAMSRAPRKDVLFIQQWMEDYGLDFELSISAYYVGKYQEALDACDRILARDDVPECIRAQTICNRKYPLDMLEQEKAAHAQALQQEALPEAG